MFLSMRDDSWGPRWCPRHIRREAPSRDVWDDILQPLAMVSGLLGSPEHFNDIRNRNEVLQQQGGSEVTIDKDKFHANFDVQHFKPDEIIVKVTGDSTVTIEAKHEEKKDEHGQIYRHFVRKYVLPNNCDINKLESKLSSDGVLSITAPTIGDNDEHKIIPIAQTGQPARIIEEKKVENAQLKNKV